MEIIPLLERSLATDAFKADVRAYLAHQPAPRIIAARLAPRVKVARVLTQLLDAEPTLPIERVYVEAVSGCSDYRGTITVHAGGDTRAFDFVWCCHWRAAQEGWRDAFGFADQIRAAHEFGWRCFQEWTELSASSPAGRVSG